MLIDVSAMDLPVSRLEFLKKLATEEPEDFDEWERSVISLHDPKEVKVLDFLLSGDKKAVAIVDEAIHRSRGQLTLF